MRGSRSAAFISPPSSKTTEDLDSKSRAIEDINFPAVTPCTRALNSLNIYKAPLSVHPFLQTSLRSSDRASTAHPCSRSSARVLRPRYLHTHSTSSNRSHFSPKYRSLQARCLCQFWGCWQDGWICACPVCAVRTVSDLCQLQLKSPKKKKKKGTDPIYPLSRPPLSCGWGGRKEHLQNRLTRTKNPPETQKEPEHNAAFSPIAAPLPRASTHRRERFAKQLRSRAESQRTALKNLPSAPSSQQPASPASRSIFA